MRRLRVSGLVVAVIAFIPAAVLALTQSQLPAKFGLAWGQNAGAPYVRSIPQTSQIGIQNCAASLNDGFPPLTFTPATAGGCPPFGQDFNGILKQLSQWAQWQSAGGPVFYDSVFAASVGGYPSGAIISSAVTPGTQWMSTADSNTTNPDASTANQVVGGTGWVQAPAQIPVGTPVQSLTTVIPTGYVSMNGTTIGDASSNGTQRANADTQFGFAFVWITCGNAQCPIFTSGGAPSTRGANAAADFAAHKAIAVPNLNGTGLIGADSQNGSSSSNLLNVPVTSGNRTTPLSILGENLHTLTASEIPTINSTVTGVVVDAAGAKIVVTTATPSNEQISGPGTGFIVPFVSVGQLFTFPTSLNQTGTGSAASNNTSGGANNDVQRSAVVYWNMKL